ncbi:hypothetical protein [Nocardioides guangzhouensis]|nr:hypothetical protein [Nocardioides guangzhouensis]
MSDQSRAAVTTTLPALVPEVFPEESSGAFPGHGDQARWTCRR